MSRPVEARGIEWVVGRQAGRQVGWRQRARGIVRPAHRQHGAALVVALILIVLTTAMGMRVMSSSALDHRMATNAALTVEILQVAESSNELVLNEPSHLDTVMADPDTALVIDTDAGVTHGARSQSVLRFVGEGNAVGASLNAAGGTGFSAFRFVVQGVAAHDTVQARRRIDQGAYRNGPSGSSR